MKTLHDPLECEALVRRIAGLRPDLHPRWGRMTAAQMICHLVDSFRACWGEKQVTPATSLLQRTVIKWLALYLPLPWPQGVPTRPEMEQGAGGTPPGDFEEDRQHLIAAIRRTSKQDHDFEWQPHPIFGTMRESQWQRWGYLHVDHHLRQFGV